ncbi:MAG: insulinase family protein [Phycisphaerales bacterium]|jgi:zinc protease|nr:insulinase family protein [Phycisphaerales bacterium]
MRRTSMLTAITLAVTAVAMLTLPGCEAPEAQRQNKLDRLAAQIAEDGLPKTPAPAVTPVKTTPVAKPLTPPASPVKPVKPVAVAAALAAKTELPVVRRIITDDTTIAELTNGMTVIIKPTRTSPVVCVQAYVRAGGMYEGKWLGCGLSHLLEHLVAGEAINNAGGEEATTDRITQIGGQSNAYTTLDHTCYYISAASSKTELCVDLIADWMTKAAITKKDFQREHGVVQRELEMGKDDPRRQMWYATSANCYSGHPASVPTIGFAPVLAKVTHQDVLDYHRKMYVPQNMVFCVVGDVDVDAVLKQVCKATLNFKRRKQPDLLLPDVKSPANIRRAVQVHKALKDTRQEIDFQTISLTDKDLYALDVLSFVLSQGQASRLVQAVERQQKLVTSVSASSWTPQWGKGYFGISFRSEPKNADAAEKAILAELKKVVENGVSDAELTRAKRQKIAELAYSQQTAEDIASQIAKDFLSTGDASFSKNYTDRIQSVTPAQVQAVAKKYFTFDRMVITRLIPPVVKTDDKQATETAAVATKPVTFTNKHGLKVVLQPSTAVGLVSMTFAVKGGILAETPETNGMGALMSSLSTRGAENFTAKQIDEFFAQAGGGISGNCGNNALYWQATVLQDSFPKALEILGEVVNKPKFEQSELDILKPKILAAIKRTDETWSTQLRKFFRSKFFTNSPYAMLSSGDKNVITKASPADVRNYYAKHIAPAGEQRGVLTIYGNFDPTAARKQVEKIFGDMPARSKWSLDSLTQKIQARKVAKEGELHTLKTTNKVAAVIVAAPSMKITNREDRFALTVLDAIISGYRLPSGWLHSELRGKQLVYVVHAYNWAGLAPGAFMTYAAGQPENAAQIVDIITKNYRRAARHVPTQKKIDEAVNSILTAELLGSQSMSELSLGAALDELYGFGYDFRSKIESHYRKVTPADVSRVAEKYLSGGYVITVTTPKPELLEKGSKSK